eukprot:536363-Pelagomonas_calceolata.AAC.1
MYDTHTHTRNTHTHLRLDAAPCPHQQRLHIIQPLLALLPIGTAQVGQQCGSDGGADVCTGQQVLRIIASPTYRCSVQPTAPADKSR